MSLWVSTFTIKDSGGKTMTLVYFNDYCVPHGVSAFFRLDPKVHNRVKCRVKDPKRLLNGQQRAKINEEMFKIAQRVAYNWTDLLAYVKSAR